MRIGLHKCNLLVFFFFFALYCSVIHFYFFLSFLSPVVVVSLHLTLGDFTIPILSLVMCLYEEDYNKVKVE